MPRRREAEVAPVEAGLLDRVEALRLDAWELLDRGRLDHEDLRHGLGLVVEALEAGRGPWLRAEDLDAEQLALAIAEELARAYRVEAEVLAGLLPAAHRRLWDARHEAERRRRVEDAHELRTLNEAELETLARVVEAERRRRAGGAA